MENTDRQPQKEERGTVPIKRWGLKLSRINKMKVAAVLLIFVALGIYFIKHDGFIFLFLIGLLAAAVTRGVLLARQYPELEPIEFRRGKFRFPRMMFKEGTLREVSIREIKKAEVSKHTNKNRTRWTLILTDIYERKVVISDGLTDTKAIIDLLNRNGVETTRKKSRINAGALIVIAVAFSVIIAMGILLYVLAGIEGPS
jgi:hypothetical protein